MVEIDIEEKSICEKCGRNNVVFSYGLSECEYCQKREDRETILAVVVLALIISILVGLVTQFNQEIGEFLNWLQDLLLSAPLFIQGFLGTLSFLLGLFVFIWIIIGNHNHR